LLQLVDKLIIVSLPEGKLSDSRDYITDKDVENKMGVPPHQVVDYKALVGDTSDNIPGVSGVGQKTAETLLEKYQTLDGVYEHLDELTASQKKKLESDKDKAYLSQKLAQIVTDLKIPVELEKARPPHCDPGAVQNLFRELEFRTLMPRLSKVMELLGMVSSGNSGEQLSLFGSQVETAPLETGLDIQTVIVDTPEGLGKLVKTLSAAKMIAFDTETTSTDQMQAELVGISVAVKPGEGFYIPVGHSKGKQLPLEEVISALRPVMTNPDIPKAGHNLKYDYVMLRRNGLDIFPLGFDTMLAEWLRDPSSRNLGLKNLAWVRLDVNMTPIDELIGKGKKQITMAEVAIEQAAPYAAADAEVTLRLVPLLKRDLQDSQADDLFNQIEMPLVKVLALMEMAGIGLDIKFLAEMSGELDERLAEIQDQVYKKVGEPFNLNSTQQLSDALFKRLNLNPPDGTRKTASGHYSTAADVLELLQDQSPVVEWVLEHRELSKLKSTYVDALPLQVNPQSGRVHTSYQQTGSVTGRIASSDPNLQNIPIRTEIGRKVRHAFVAQPGNLLLAVDYSQVELRVVAHMAQDKAMIQAFREDQDIHAATAAAVMGVPLDQVSKDQRRHAKAINFGLIYGMSAFGLTRSTELTLAEAEDFVEAYFQQFPGVKIFLDNLRQQALEQEYVETLLGRRRYFPGLGSQRNQQIKNRQLREAINAPVQGTAAD
ncbi:MAG: DNA polymerase I, partial [Spirochaetota bacterium]